MDIGIVGLANSTKTTLYNALTRSQVITAATSSGQIEFHTASIEVPDPRVNVLAEMFQPKKVTYARVQYTDVAGLRVGTGRGGGISGELLNSISHSDALIHVIRAFEDERIPHPAGSVDAIRDYTALEFEFLVSDLVIVEKRLEHLTHDLERKGSYPERMKDEEEFNLFEKVKKALENELPVREMGLGDEEMKALRGFQLLTAKPVLVVVNVGDNGSDNPSDVAIKETESRKIVCLRGALEMEISQLAQEDAALFLSEFGISEPGLNRMIRMSYQLLGLQSFFTVGEDEVRAWTVPCGASAAEAAGTIHSDLARGFIRAEVVAYKDLITAGTLAAARKVGALRLEGRDYRVQDGDILNIRFNV